MANERPTKMFKVTDTSATAAFPNRTHEIILNGEVKSIKFQYGEPTSLPFEEAAKFQKSEGFIVTNDDGDVMVKPSDVPPAVMHTMKTNECVARFDELTKDALYIRAVMLPGGEMFKGNSSKDELIAFLVDANVNAITPNDGNGQSAPASGGLSEDMTDEELAAMAEKLSQEAA